ncbi:hypothetical protein ABZW30_38805 [Kitasatospora sp. NPDC004669]|uniref:hypothetical protein n=1 Tax=Kitasatospora sp. NPDC004669 TaxID=3154555 RepID=UPI0033B94BAF
MDRRGLVVLKGCLWIAPIDPHGLQCVARTKQGGLCKNPVSYSQELSWYEFHLGAHGYVDAYDGQRFKDADRWLAQHCTTHDTLDVIDIAEPELRPFHVAHDAALVRRYREDVTYDGGQPATG